MTVGVASFAVARDFPISLMRISLACHVPMLRLIWDRPADKSDLGSETVPELFPVMGIHPCAAGKLNATRRCRTFRPMVALAEGAEIRRHASMSEMFSPAG